MPTRREMLGQTLSAAGAVSLLATTDTAGAAESPADEPFGIALNTSTIRGQKLPLAAEIDIVARAGYQGIEPWVNEIDAHEQAGGTRADLRKRIADHGLAVVGLIGFAEWIVDDDARRAKGLEEARRIMDMAAEIGATLPGRAAGRLHRTRQRLARHDRRALPRAARIGRATRRRAGARTVGLSPACSTS